MKETPINHKTNDNDTVRQILQEKHDLIVHCGANGSVWLTDSRQPDKELSVERIDRFIDEAERDQVLSKEKIEKLRLWGGHLKTFPLNKDK